MSRSLKILQCTLMVFFFFFFGLLVLLLVLFYLVMSLVVGSVLFSVMIVPSVLLYLFVAVKKNFVWRNKSRSRSSTADKGHSDAPATVGASGSASPAENIVAVPEASKPQLIDQESLLIQLHQEPPAPSPRY